MNILDGLEAEIARVKEVARENPDPDLWPKLFVAKVLLKYGGNTFAIVAAYNQLKAIK